MVVSEVKSWGVQGYVKIPGRNQDGGEAYYRVPFDKCVYCGEARFVHAEDAAADGR